jgi:hypothetical protein
MRRHATRRVPFWTAIPLILVQVGCAGREVHAPPALSHGSITEAAWRTCEDTVRQRKTPMTAGRPNEGLAGLSLVMLSSEGLSVLGVRSATRQAGDASLGASRLARDAAVRECLAALRLRQEPSLDLPGLADGPDPLVRGDTILGYPTRAEPRDTATFQTRETAPGSGHRSPAIEPKRVTSPARAQGE